MRTFVMIALTALSLIGCSHSPTEPSTSPTAPSTSRTAPSAPVVLPVYPGDPGTPLWHATSTVVSVSETLNSCPVDHAVGETRNVVWAIGPGPLSPSSIVAFESPDSVGGCAAGDPRAPCYVGSCLLPVLQRAASRASESRGARSSRRERRQTIRLVFSWLLPGWYGLYGIAFLASLEATRPESLPPSQYLSLSGTTVA